MLIAQSMTDGLTVLTHDRAFAPYGRSSAQLAFVQRPGCAILRRDRRDHAEST